VSVKRGLFAVAVLAAGVWVLPATHGKVQHTVPPAATTVPESETATGFGYNGQDIADSRWDPSDKSTGDITYYHPDHGWMNAATGHRIELEHDGLERT
jgi:hypothetical protein